MAQFIEAVLVTATLPATQGPSTGEWLNQLWDFIQWTTAQPLKTGNEEEHDVLM